jgi:hypothetical protein
VHVTIRHAFSPKALYKRHTPSRIFSNSDTQTSHLVRDLARRRCTKITLRHAIGLKALHKCCTPSRIWPTGVTQMSHSVTHLARRRYTCHAVQTLTIHLPNVSAKCSSVGGYWATWTNWRNALSGDPSSLTPSVCCYYGPYAVIMLRMLLLCCVCCYYATFVIIMLRMLLLCYVYCCYAPYAVIMLRMLLLCSVCCYYAPYVVIMLRMLLLCSVCCYYAT